ncbi:MAG: ABC transporter ATP-binding protein [Paracoccus sp. (in: a-proteobacteria)]|nr:ABC transporter ATP-binding protein [Paracoccus sp. (in: a-proteobacteria)]
MSFQVRKGSIFGLLGQNGAGKTTILKVLSTLLLPSAGEVKVLGHDVKRDYRWIRSRIAIMFGGERGLYGRLTGQENLAMFYNLHALPMSSRADTLARLATEVGLDDTILHRRVMTYSRGMRQKLHLARTLLNDPEVVFLDEPTIGLDVEAAERFRTMVRRLRDQGRTVVLTSHYMRDIEELCDHVVIIKDGRLVLDQPYEDLRRREIENRKFVSISLCDPLDAGRVGLIGELARLGARESKNDGGFHMVLERQDPTDRQLLERFGAAVAGYSTRDVTFEDIYLRYAS